MDDRRQKLLENVKNSLLATILSNPKALYVHEILSEYQQMTSSALPYVELGFKSLEELFRALSDIVFIKETSQGRFLLTVVADSNSPHLHQMLNGRWKSGWSKAKKWKNRITRYALQNGPEWQNDVIGPQISADLQSENKTQSSNSSPTSSKNDTGQHFMLRSLQKYLSSSGKSFCKDLDQLTNIDSNRCENSLFEVSRQKNAVARCENSLFEVSRRKNAVARVVCVDRLIHVVRVGDIKYLLTFEISGFFWKVDVLKQKRDDLCKDIEYLSIRADDDHVDLYSQLQQSCKLPPAPEILLIPFGDVVKALTRIFRDQQKITQQLMKMMKLVL